MISKTIRFVQPIESIGIIIPFPEEYLEASHWPKFSDNGGFIWIYIDL
jgi:hypothetical protein